MIQWAAIWLCCNTVCGSLFTSSSSSIVFVLSVSRFMRSLKTAQIRLSCYCYTRGKQQMVFAVWAVECLWSCGFFSISLAVQEEGASFFADNTYGNLIFVSWDFSIRGRRNNELQADRITTELRVFDIQCSVLWNHFLVMLKTVVCVLRQRRFVLSRSLHDLIHVKLIYRL
jgi:hypothetical protein